MPRNLQALWLLAGVAVCVELVAHMGRELDLSCGEASLADWRAAGSTLDARRLEIPAAQMEHVPDGDRRVRLPAAWRAATDSPFDGLRVFIDGRAMPLTSAAPDAGAAGPAVYYHGREARSVRVRCGIPPASCREVVIVRADAYAEAILLLHRLAVRPGWGAATLAAALALLALALAGGGAWHREHGARAAVGAAAGVAAGVGLFFAAELSRTAASAWFIAAHCVLMGGPALERAVSRLWESWRDANSDSASPAAWALPLPAPWVAGLAVAVFAGRVATSMFLASPTLDEVTHIPAGYAYCTRGDFWLNPEHPPLVKLASGLGVVLLNGPVEWQASREAPNAQATGRWFFASDRVRRTFSARLPMFLFSVPLLILLYGLVRRLFGAATAALVVVAMSTSPVLVAHSALVHTDVAAGLAFLAVFATVAVVPSRAGGLARAALLGAVVAVGMLMKFSVALAAVALVAGLPAWTARGRRLRVLATFVLSLAACFLLSSWAAYGGRSERAPAARTSVAARWVQAAIPSFYRQGWTKVQGHNAQGHSSVFLRRPQRTGHVAYFPVAYALKTPLPVVAATLGGLLVLLRRPPWWFPAWAALAGTYGVFMLASRINIGIRHAMPVVVLLAVPLAAGVRWLLAGARRRRVGLMLLAWLAGTSLLHAGGELAYFNELAGGQGWRFLGDSNVDWGQDNGALGRYAERHALDPLYHDLTTALPPEWLGVPGLPLARGLDGGRPRGGWYAVSAARLATDDPALDAFRVARPSKVFGGAVHLYFVEGRSSPPR